MAEPKLESLSGGANVKESDSWNTSTTARLVNDETKLLCGCGRVNMKTASRKRSWKTGAGTEDKYGDRMRNRNDIRISNSINVCKWKNRKEKGDQKENTHGKRSRTQPQDGINIKQRPRG